MQLAILGFKRQDYPNVELILIDSSDTVATFLENESQDIKYYYEKDGNTLGYYRNLACELAEGDFIVHLDDDDIYSEDWVSRLVENITYSKADICGLSTLSFYAINSEKLWKYRHPEDLPPWVLGATFIYRKAFWKKHRFRNFQAGEDIDFMLRSRATVYSIDYSEGYLGVVHADNVAIAPFDNPFRKIVVFKWTKALGKVDRKNINKECRLKEAGPTVSCIMPTSNRRNFIQGAIQLFQKQNYLKKELIIIDDGTQDICDLIGLNPNINYIKIQQKHTIGAKRNIACTNASGDIIVHLDDDDWYAHDWLSRQVHSLNTTDADICGLDQIQFYSVKDNKYWMTKNYNSRKLWLSGATLAYRKSFWEKYPFKDIQIGGR